MLISILKNERDLCEMKNFKLFSIILSLALLISILSSPGSSYAATTNNNSDDDQATTSGLQIIFENEFEKKYTIPENDYIYHEKYVNENGKNIAQITIYSTDENEVIDYYEHEIGDSSQIMPRCGPPCGYIAVIAVREIVDGVVSYHLKKSKSSATLKTVKIGSVARVQPIISGYTSVSFQVAGTTFKINKSDMQHFLTRHDVKYFAKDGNSNDSQTFFVDSLKPLTINAIAKQAVEANITKIIQSSTNFVTMDYTHNGIVYRVGVNKGFNAITQLYPKKTYLKE